MCIYFYWQTTYFPERAPLTFAEWMLFASVSWAFSALVWSSRGQFNNNNNNNNKYRHTKKHQHQPHTSHASQRPHRPRSCSCWPNTFFTERIWWPLPGRVHFFQLLFVRKTLNEPRWSGRDMAVAAVAAAFHWCPPSILYRYLARLECYSILFYRADFIL